MNTLFAQKPSCKFIWLVQGLTLTALFLALASCGVSTITVEGSFPSPSVQAEPLKVAVYYDDALRDFSYIEYSEAGAEEFDIRSGNSAIELFNALLPGMFAEVVVIDSLEDADSFGVDVIFEPLIEEFQLALPEKTKLNVYEVWMRFNMRLTEPDGGFIADWMVTSYGKTPVETFRSSESAINEAAVIAFRDLASSFALSFRRVPGVRDWLETQDRN